MAQPVASEDDPMGALDTQTERSLSSPAQSVNTGQERLSPHETEATQTPKSSARLAAPEPGLNSAPVLLPALELNEAPASVTSPASTPPLVSHDVMSHAPGLNSFSSSRRHHDRAVPHRLRAPWGDDTLGLPFRHSRTLSEDSSPDDGAAAASGTQTPTGVVPRDAEPLARLFLEFRALGKISAQCASSGEITCFVVSGGHIVVGTSSGASLVFDLGQRLRCSCAPPEHGIGSVTALAVSHEGLYLGVGYATGHLYLYDLHHPTDPARHVPPAQWDSLVAGKAEGHLPDTPITHLHFVGARKTALISADGRGLCFYHSLGRMLGMASNDTLRLYGQYDAPLPCLPAVYDAAPLPKGTAPHPADQHHFVAILLPTKLLLMGLRPVARTWQRYTAPSSSSPHAALAWFPATTEAHRVEPPILAFSFGASPRLVELRTARVRPREADVASQTHAVVMFETTLPAAPEPIVQLHWVHHQLLLVGTLHRWLLYDRRRSGYTEWQPHDPIAAVHEVNGAVVELQIWRSKTFLQARQQLYVGDFVSWDAELQQLERSRRWPDAIRLVLKLYQGRDLGSALGLPDSRDAQQAILATRLMALQRAALPDIVAGMVDTDTLAGSCAEAAHVLQSWDLFFGDVYDAYERADRESELVQAVEPFILQGHLSTPPPAVMQRLAMFCDQTKAYARLEQLILHVDPLYLDLNQVLPMCTAHWLWDALSYIYEQAMHDPLMPLAYLHRRIVQRLREGTLHDHEDERLYSVFPLLGARLRGLEYPSLEKKSPEMAGQAAHCASTWLFSPGQMVWPGFGELTALDEDPYPYLRALLLFDAEPLLDVLDVALEGEFVADESSDDSFTRSKVVHLLLSMARSGRMPRAVQLYLALFVSHNASKYPQFVSLANDDVAWLFTTLTSDGHHGDSEFALERLLSTHNLDMTDERLAALQHAMYYQVYELVLRKAQLWERLFVFYLVDQDGQHHAPGQLTARIAALLTQVGLRRRSQREGLAPVLLQHVEDIPDSLLGDLARLVARYLPSSAHEVFSALTSSPRRQYLFLSPFFSVEHSVDKALPESWRAVWMERLSEFGPSHMVSQLEAHGAGFFDLEQVLEAAMKNHVYDVALWVLDRSDRTMDAMNFLDERMQATVAQVLDWKPDQSDSASLQVSAMRRESVQQWRDMVRMALKLCIEHSTTQQACATHARELWYRVLHTLVAFEQALAPLRPLASDTPSPASYAWQQGQDLLQEALAALVASVPSDTVSFPHLFARLANTSEKLFYMDVRAIIDAMLSAYRLRAEMLTLGVRLNEADIVRLFETLLRERASGRLITPTRSP